MENTQEYIITEKDNLLEKIAQYKADGYKLAQISATKLQDKFDLLYSLEKNYHLINLRLQIDLTTKIESISGIYAYAFLYENELKDLFGIKILNINIDFKGNLYKTSIKTPFNQDEK